MTTTTFFFRASSIYRPYDAEPGTAFDGHQELDSQGIVRDAEDAEDAMLKVRGHLLDGCDELISADIAIYQWEGADPVKHVDPPAVDKVIDWTPFSPKQDDHQGGDVAQTWYH